MKMVVMVMALVPTMAFANSKQALADLDTTYKACMDKAESNADMKGCTFDAYQKADGLLNASYKSIVADLKKASGDTDMDKSNAETLTRLVKSERAWVAFRDAECDFEGTEMLGGSGESLVVGGCLYDQTVQRVKSIEETISVP